MGVKLKSSTGDKDQQIKVGNTGNTQPKGQDTKKP